MQFVLHHAPGVRRLRFIRKLPLLKGLSDQVIIKVGESVKEEVFQVRGTLLRLGSGAFISSLTSPGVITIAIVLGSFADLYGLQASGQKLAETALPGTMLAIPKGQHRDWPP